MFPSFDACRHKPTRSVFLLLIDSRRPKDMEFAQGQFDEIPLVLLTFPPLLRQS